MVKKSNILLEITKPHTDFDNGIRLQTQTEIIERTIRFIPTNETFYKHNANLKLNLVVYLHANSSNLFISQMYCLIFLTIPPCKIFSVLVNFQLDFEYLLKRGGDFFEEVFFFTYVK